MRKMLLIAALLLGVVAGVVAYALLNLNSIIQSQRSRILAGASDALGRAVEVGDIKATLGWGVAIDLTNVKVAEDPAFSQLPCVQASDVYLKVEFVPLLYKRVRITELDLKQPQLRIIRNPAGLINVSTIAKKAGKTAESAPAADSRQGAKTGALKGASPMESAGGSAAGRESPILSGLSITTLSIGDGTVFYQDQKASEAPIRINALNLKVDRFSFGSPFNLAVTLAALGDTKNLDLSGKVGPIMHAGTVDVNSIPIDFAVAIGPLTQAELKSLPQLAHALAPALSISDAVNLKAKISGTVAEAGFDVDSDLTSNHVAYAPAFDKPAGVALKFSGSGERKGTEIVVRRATVTLASVVANATDIVVGAGPVSARLDTNNFDIAPVANLVAAARQYNANGAAEIHSKIALANKRPSLDGTIALHQVNVTVPSGKAPPIGGLSGTIRLAGNTANAGPLSLNLGSGHARLSATAQSLQPLRATYNLSVDKVTIAELVPSRKDAGDESLVRLAASGSLADNGGALAASARATAASGMVQNVSFNNLALDADYTGNRATVNSLKLGAFSGTIAASGAATLGPAPIFDLKLITQGIDLQQALESQQSKAADTIRGNLTANLQIGGGGRTFEQIKPTLHGAGRAEIANGKLVGVNVVAQALAKADNIPGIGALVPESVVANHPELFRSHDTDIQSASLTFQMTGPRIITHDLTVQSPDYTVLGDGWFDLDKNIDLSARILMSPGFSRELVAAKRNVSYLTNQNEQVEIPLRITGQLPKPAVLPDVGALAQRAAGHAVQNKLGELLQKKGLGGLLGGKNSGSEGGGGSPGGIPNPFKGLFH